MNEEGNDEGLFRRLEGYVAIDPADVLGDAREAGIDVSAISDLADPHAHRPGVERLLGDYGGRAIRYSVATSVVSGVSIPFVSAGVGVGDAVNGVGQIYRFVQRAAFLHGIDPRSPSEREMTTDVLLGSLGFDEDMRARIKRQLFGSGVLPESDGLTYPEWAKKLVLIVARKYAIRFAAKQAARLIPLFGSMLGGAMSYRSATRAVAHGTDALRDVQLKRANLKVDRG